MMDIHPDVKLTLELMLPKGYSISDYLIKDKLVENFISEVVKQIETELEHNKKLYGLTGVSLCEKSATNLLKDYSKVLKQT